MSSECPLCQGKRRFWQNICKDCKTLFKILQANMGTMGLSQLMDELIATGIPKDKIYRFLNTPQEGQGSLLDQVTAGLTNNLAEGMGVKEKQMTAEDVRRIRENPHKIVSTKPLDN